MSKKKYGGAAAAPQPQQLNKPALMKKMTPKYAELILTLNTNIPEGDEFLKTKQIKLTGAMLNASSNRDKGPFFSADVLYSDGAVFFSGLTAQERIDVFFNNAKFVNFIQTCYLKRQTRDVNEYEKLRLNALETPYDFAHQNMMFMFSKIITITFPRTDQVNESYKGSDGILGISSSSSGLTRMFNKIMRTELYTHLIIDGKKYTIVKARWLNDFYSHPTFLDIYKKYMDYSDWLEKEKSKLIDQFQSEITTMYLKSRIRKTVYDINIVEHIFMAIAADFNTEEVTIKKMTNISVPLNISGGVREYGKTELYKTYKNKQKAEEERKKAAKKRRTEENIGLRNEIREFIKDTYNSIEDQTALNAKYVEYLNKKVAFKNIKLENTVKKQSKFESELDELNNDYESKSSLLSDLERSRRDRDRVRGSSKIDIEDVEKQENMRILESELKKLKDQAERKVKEVIELKRRVAELKSEIADIEAKKGESIDPEVVAAAVARFADEIKNDYPNLSKDEFVDDYISRSLDYTVSNADDDDGASSTATDQTQTTIENEVRVKKEKYATRTADTTIDGEYKDYVNFIKYMYKIISGNENWKTFMELKKKYLSNIKDNVYSSRLKEVLENLNTITNYTGEITRNRFYVGVQKNADKKFESVLYVDLVGGEITYANASLIKCTYQDYKMGRELKILFDGEVFENERVFVDFDKYLRKGADTNSSGSTAAAAAAAAAATAPGKKEKKKTKEEKNDDKKSNEEKKEEDKKKEENKKKEEEDKLFIYGGRLIRNIQTKKRRIVHKKRTRKVLRKRLGKKTQRRRAK